MMTVLKAFLLILVFTALDSKNGVEFADTVIRLVKVLFKDQKK